MPSEFVCSFTQALFTSSPSDAHDGSTPPDPETVKVYADALDLYLSQALHAEAEAEYWAQVESSTVALCVYYFYSAYYYPFSYFLSLMFSFAISSPTQTATEPTIISLTPPCLRLF